MYSPPKKTPERTKVIFSAWTPDDLICLLSKNNQGDSSRSSSRKKAAENFVIKQLCEGSRSRFYSMSFQGCTHSSLGLFPTRSKGNSRGAGSPPLALEWSLYLEWTRVHLVSFLTCQLWMLKMHYSLPNEKKKIMRPLRLLTSCLFPLHGIQRRKETLAVFKHSGKQQVSHGLDCFQNLLFIFFILLDGKLMITFTIFRGKLCLIMEVTHLW